MATSRSAGRGVSMIHWRICAPASTKVRTSSTFRLASLALMRWSKPPCFKNSRNAWAVVAKPPGTRTPAVASWLIISPSEAFLPPTDSTSVILKRSNGATRAVDKTPTGATAVVSDMGKLRDVSKPVRPQKRPQPQRWRAVLGIRVQWGSLQGGEADMLRPILGSSSL